MRILFLTNYYPPFEVGGYEQLCRDIAERLTARGHETSVITSRRGIKSSQEWSEPRSTHRVLITQPNYESWLGPAWQFFLTRPWVDRHNRRWLRRVVAEVHPDIIFIWNMQGLTRRLALDAESLPYVAVAYWLAGYSPAEPDGFWHYWSIQPKVRSELGTIKAAMRRLAIGIMRREDKPLRLAMKHVAVVSSFMREKGITEGTLPDHAQVIYNGVEIEGFQRVVQPRGQSALQLLQAGRVEEDKGVHIAIKALSLLVHEQGIPEIHLTVVGSGRSDYEAELRHLIKRFDLDRHVTLVGRLPREAMPTVMAKSHVLLLPTVIHEAFARVILEAMAAGLAVIASDTGGTPEIIEHGITGLLFRAANSADLAAQIRRLWEEPDLRERLATAGQRRVLADFSLDRMVDNVERFLNQVLASDR